MSYEDDEAFLTDDDGGHQDEYAPRSRRPRMEPHRGTLVLVLGILGLLVCFICGIFSWVMGNEDLKKMKAGRMDPEGESITNAGRILGIVACVLNLGVFLLIALGMCGALVAGGSSSIDYGG